MSSGLILLDVFSYSCMNCLRSLEFIKKIDKKYSNFGLSTILVHPPEWKFEKNLKNISYLIKKYRIDFPVIFDGDRKVIKKLSVDFWPAQLLVSNGKILYRHIGEGNYEKLEDKIAQLLKIKTRRIFNKLPQYSRFPTVYCGRRKYGRVLDLGSKLKFGVVYAEGKWAQKEECLKSVRGRSSLTVLTKGKRVNFVAQSLANKPIQVTIELNGKFHKKLAINRPQLYNLTKSGSDKQNKLAVITPKNLAVYSFSFQ